jgi:hypothetical protein
MNGTYGDSCATTEGFASYVGILGLWDPDVMGAHPMWSGGLDVEAGPMARVACGDNRGSPMQVMRAFWDLDDVDNSDAGPAVACFVPEAKNSLSISILNVWDKFPDGNTANRHDYEPDADGHAVNLWDYAWNAWGSGSSWGAITNYEALLHHNCVGPQDKIDDPSEPVPVSTACANDRQ